MVVEKSVTDVELRFSIDFLHYRLLFHFLLLFKIFQVFFFQKWLMLRSTLLYVEKVFQLLFEVILLLDHVFDTLLINSFFSLMFIWALDMSFYSKIS